MDSLATYLKEIERQLATGRATEHTHRAALQNLVESLDKGITATNEPTRIACGAPDFIVTKGAAIVGYIEAKDIGANLDEVERSDQLKRYLDGLPNLILTDYLEFRLYQQGELVMSARLALAGPQGRLRRDESHKDGLTSLLDAFLGASFPIIATPHDLAQRMAATARLLRDVIGRAFETGDKDSALHSQLEAFQKVLLHDLDAGQFADMYAQTICYGLFAARCNHKPGNGAFIRRAAVYELPETNPFLRQMFMHIAGPELDPRLSWAVDHLTTLLDQADMNEILRNFGRRTRQEDPVVHFYETFLAAYDPALRETRGVYYTPEPVVSYIVRSVDKILKRDFGIRDGLAASDKVPLYETHQGRNVSTPERKKLGDIHCVLILDPATGTGTFLHGVIDHIHETVIRGGAGLWDGYVSEHLLPRLFGFELLMAPYAVAHMKLGIQLAETGYTFRRGERLRVYLTNTLEEAFDLGDLPLFANLIAEEANAAGLVKSNYPVMVVLGNPPYSGLSANMNDWSDTLLKTRLPGEGGAQSYYTVDGSPLGERKTWLQDDYVKFFRFAQWRIEQTGYGILAFVSNHGYLDNPTFRGMRQSLMQTFDDIFILDLHGNSRKKECAPDGVKDENVFNIQQGVAIGLFVKRPKGAVARPVTVRHADLWGAREVWESVSDGTRELVGGKYAALLGDDVESTHWTKVEPCTPLYLYVPEDGERRAEYEKGWPITGIMTTNTSGIVTARDQFVIDLDRARLIARMAEFRGEALSDDEIRAKYFQGKGSSKYSHGDTRGWKLPVARAALRNDKQWREHVAPCLYRPFDHRFMYYHPTMVDWPRAEVMRHMLAGHNLGLATTRSIEIGRGWEHVCCTRDLIQHHTVSIKEVNYLFPLYLYPNNGDKAHDIEELAAREEAAVYGVKRRPNLAAAFLDALAGRIRLIFVPDGAGDLKKTFGPEDVFHYIYAVFHSPMYRERYAEFLKRDFPRVPLTAKRPLFRELCGLGAQLVKLHLLDDVPDGPVTFPVAGDNRVEKPCYVEAAERVHINDAQYFDGVPANVWQFHIGGYQVCEKWLQDRKSCLLSFDDQQHYRKIVSALSETIRLMNSIDALVDRHGGWPLDGERE